MDVLPFIVGLLIGALVGVVSQVGAGDVEREAQPRRTPTLFTLVVGIALGAALFGDDDE